MLSRIGPIYFYKGVTTLFLFGMYDKIPFLRLSHNLIV